VPKRSSADPRRRQPRRSGPRRRQPHRRAASVPQPPRAARSRPTRARSATSGTMPCHYLEIEPGNKVGFDTRETADLHYTPRDRRRRKPAHSSSRPRRGL